VIKFNKEKIITKIATVYFMIGVIFAIFFAIYYKWHPLSFLSPNFFSVVFTWPFQAIGFIRDLLTYGLTGKSI